MKVMFVALLAALGALSDVAAGNDNVSASVESCRVLNESQPRLIAVARGSFKSTFVLYGRN